jgi:hypothetical protein
MPGLPSAASAAPARRKPSIGAPGAWTTKATPSLRDSLRMVCGVPPALVPEVEARVTAGLSGDRLRALREDLETIRRSATDELRREPG